MSLPRLVIGADVLTAGRGRRGGTTWPTKCLPPTERGRISARSPESPAESGTAHRVPQTGSLNIWSEPDQGATRRLAGGSLEAEEGTRTPDLPLTRRQLLRALGGFVEGPSSKCRLSPRVRVSTNALRGPLRSRTAARSRDAPRSRSGLRDQACSVGFAPHVTSGSRCMHDGRPSSTSIVRRRCGDRPLRTMPRCQGACASDGRPPRVLRLPLRGDLATTIQTDDDQLASRLRAHTGDADVESHPVGRG